MLAWLIIGTLVMTAGSTAASAQARVNNLSDVAFGTLGQVAADRSSAQSLCVYSGSQRYSVTATGSGTRGAFTLTNGRTQLPYEVQWGFAGDQPAGTALNPGIGLSGTVAFFNNLFCSASIGSSASLIVILRAASIGSAGAGDYTGTLTLLVAPE